MVLYSAQFGLLFPVFPGFGYNDYNLMSASVEFVDLVRGSYDEGDVANIPQRWLC